MFRVIYSKDWNILLTSDSFLFRAKFITGCYWIATWKKALFHLFLWLEITPQTLPILQSFQFFKLFRWQSKSLIYRDKKSWWFSQKTFGVSGLMQVKKQRYWGIIFVCSIFLDQQFSGKTVITKFPWSVRP